MPLDRHRIVRIDPARWPTILAGHPAAGVAEVAGWIDAGRPLIARRPLCDDAAGLVPLGLPLPPALGKRRLAFAVPADAISSDAPPPLLSDAIATAPAGWHATIAAIVAIDPDTRCFGGLAWAHLTGLDYLSATSDLDLLWRVADANAADRLAEAVASVAADAPMRIDGEMLLPDGSAVQWREWAFGAAELIVKAVAGNRLIARAAAFG